ncbi:MAG TPA: hypothetical protein VG410_01140 [Solirubrobacteraceae bacterium]|jgi:hypothetical protein|nr:hypothetical protein [Solirubrobacteraceae bacterium]
MTIRNRLTIALLAAAAAAVLSAVPAHASGIGTTVLADCNAHDALTKSYTVAELRNALATMPANMKEYTDCPDVISRALDNALGTGGKSNGAGPSSGGSSLSTGVIVVIVVLVLAASTLGAIAIRRRRGP